MILRLSRLYLKLIWGTLLTLLNLQAYASSEQKEERSSAVSVSREQSMWGIGEDQLDELFCSTSNVICLADHQFFHRINTAYINTFGSDEQEILSQPYNDQVHPDDRLVTQRIASQSIDNSRVHHPLDSKNDLQMVMNFENRLRTKQGDYRDLQWLILLQVAGTTTQAPILCIGQDVTLKKQAAVQQQTLEQAQVATRIKSTFVAHMSHELRTPLNGVLNFIELALEEEVSNKVRTYLMHAYDSAKLLLEIANDIIDVSRIEANALKIDRIDFDPRAEVAALIPLVKLQTDRKKLHFEVSISPTVPTFLKGDPGRLKQILLNLSSNAIKFTAHGKISLKLAGYKVPNHPTLYQVQGRVKDTGIGMDPQFVKRLFQPFSQEDHSMKRQFGGAGLGLYITKELCEKMGGSITVMSTPGLGSTFQFQYNLETSDLDSTATTLTHSASFLPTLAAPLPVSTILVVDDNAMNQEILKIWLTGWGCAVDVALNGTQAVAAIQGTLYDLIVMDGEMPEMDGLEATRQIRRQFSPQQLPIIGLTAHAMTNHRAQFLQAGMNGYLTKPLNREALIHEIWRCCPRK